MLKPVISLEQMERSLTELSNEQAKIRQRIESYIPSVLLSNISYQAGRLIINTPYFDQFASDEDTQSIFGKAYASTAERVAFEIRDADYPTSASEGLRFCELMGFNTDETGLIVKACSSDDQYENWLSEERRANSF